jgi:hypothetical protein
MENTEKVENTEKMEYVDDSIDTQEASDIDKVLNKRPLKSKKLKIIDYLGTYYATFDGSKNWKVEKWLFNLLKLCDGKRTFEQIAQYLSKIAEVPLNHAMENLKEVFDELEREKLISYI